MLKVQQLRQFVIAASSGSFKAAAATTFRSQSAVSIAMRELEGEIGVALLEPGRRGKFTPAAEALLPLFKELLAVHDRVLAQSREIAVGEQGSVSLAVAPFLAEEWLPDVLERFAAAVPRVRIRAVEERSSLIRRMVADGEADIGVAGLLADDARLNIRPVAVDAFGVLCSANHSIARRRAVPWNALHGERLIGSDAVEILVGAGLADLFDPPELVVTSRASLFACVRRDLGVTILPMLTRPLGSAGLAFVPLSHPRLSRTLALLTRRSESLLPAGARLEAMLFESLREFARTRGAPLVEPGAPARMRPRR